MIIFFFPAYNINKINKELGCDLGWTYLVNLYTLGKLYSGSNVNEGNIKN